MIGQDFRRFIIYGVGFALFTVGVNKVFGIDTMSNEVIFTLSAMMVVVAAVRETR